MSDFLDNLILRHVDATPQIMPRLPSIFEPEVTRGGLNVAVPDKNILEIEETVYGFPVRMKESVPSHVEAMDPPPSTQVAIPTALPTTIEPVQQRAAPALTVPANEEKPSAKAVLSESAFFLPHREAPSVPPPPQGRGEEGTAATPIAPVTGRVCRARQEERMEHTAPNPETTAEERTSFTERVNRPVFSLSPRERAGVRGTDSTSDPLTLSRREGRLTQGLLIPSATLISLPVPPEAGPKRPMSQPEPVINVTIGRIEVRATVAPQKPMPKSESRVHVMTLDEYLQKRSKGDR